MHDTSGAHLSQRTFTLFRAALPRRKALRDGVFVSDEIRRTMPREAVKYDWKHRLPDVLRS